MEKYGKLNVDPFVIRVTKLQYALLSGAWRSSIIDKKKSIIIALLKSLRPKRKKNLLHFPKRVNCIDGFEVYSSRHVRLNMESVHREAAILHQIRFEKSVVHLEGLYVGPSHCVLVTEYLGGGDLVERVSR